MTAAWDVKKYSQFLDLRTRPARDLLSAIPNSFQPKIVCDLGCGPGNSTILLKDRWPHAKVIGIDSSIEMLEVAKATYPDISFIEEDIAHFSPIEKVDCLFANASLQWVDDHEKLIPKLLDYINPGGVLGIQMPNNFHSPSHQSIVKILQSNKHWQPLLQHLCYGELSKPLYRLSWYYDLLVNSGTTSQQFWETEYFQEMSDYQGIFDWVKGTALRPVLSEMDAKQQAQFRDAYLEAILKAYPLQTNNKVLLPFKRIFILGYKNSL